MKNMIATLLLFFCFNSFANTKVVIDTNLGEIEVELFDAKAPKTVANFLSYVDKKFYDGTIFHRVIDNFMIQGGGFTPDLKKKDTDAAIVNEANNGLTNETGTLAMARTMDPNSATSQFFINVRNNPHLNYTGPNPQGFGYAVFGKVSKGMSVVNRIKKVKTGNNGPYQNVPVENIVINKVTRK